MSWESLYYGFIVFYFISLIEMGDHKSTGIRWKLDFLPLASKRTVAEIKLILWSNFGQTVVILAYYIDIKSLHIGF